MLGDLIAEEKIKIIGRRVLSVDDGIPKIETSTAGTGNYKGTGLSTNFNFLYNSPN